MTFTLYALSAQYSKSLRVNRKNDGVVEEGKTALFAPLAKSEKNGKKI